MRKYAYPLDMNGIDIENSACLIQNPVSPVSDTLTNSKGHGPFASSHERDLYKLRKGSYIFLRTYNVQY